MASSSRNTANFKDFIKNFESSSKDQVVYYIGVGSAANLSGKNIFGLKSEQNQQYTPYVRFLKSNFPNLGITVILIDPCLSTPPYCVKEGVSLGEEWINDRFKNVYVNKTDNITVWEIKECVDYSINSSGTGYTNILNDLTLLNKMVIDCNDILLFHDFSGRDTYFLSYYFDNMLEGYKDRIVYDLTLRMEGSCFVNMSDKMFFLQPYVENGYVKLFNPYNLKGGMFCTKYKSSNSEIKRKQIAIALRMKLKMVLSHIYPILRRLVIRRKDVASGKYDTKVIFYPKQYGWFELLTGYSVDNICKTVNSIEPNSGSGRLNDLDICINTVENILFSKLIDLLNTVNEIEMSQCFINQIYDDPYKWSGWFESFFLDKMVTLGFNLD